MSVKMEGVGTEVSEKIRAAIKAKLIELGAYVDDELPDYIMVMVANKRSRVQMEDDLALFLNNNTKVFTAWLHNVLKKLQEVTVAAGEKIDEPKKIRKKASPHKEIKSPNGYKKSKKKHSKKHKEKKPKKLKRKLKDSENVVASDLSDWESPVETRKKIKEEKPETVDVRKEVGRAIIGSLKEKHKGEVVKESKEVATVKDSQEQIKPAEEVGNDNPEEILVEIEGSNLDQEQNGSDGISIIEVKSMPNDASNQSEPTVMAPTKELLKKHDQLTKKVESGVKPESEISESPEELRRKLLLSRAKKKLEERNLERRMKSNSPEVVIVAEKNKADVVKEVEPIKKDKTPPIDSPKLSLGANSSIDDYFSAGDSSSSRYKKNKRRNKVVVESRIVAIPQPEEPGISSVVLVKPRQFAPHEKQANKNLILKAVAAAERSVAQAPARITKDEPSSNKSSKRPKAIFTRDLRGKRYEMINVTLPNVQETDSTAKNPRHVDDEWESEGKCSNKKSGEEENFISSKTMGKDRNESFIQCWLDEVEEAGKHNALIKPDEIDAAAIPEEHRDEPDDSLNEDKESNGHIDALQDGPQIVVTVDGHSSSQKKPSNKISSKVDLNRISNRFARISKPAEDHEFKEKYKEFERVRTEKKVSMDGESKNKRLIAELSMKFGQVNRIFDNDANDVRERLGEVKRNESSRKRDATKSSDVETPKEKRDRKSVRVSAEYDDVRMKSKERCRFWPDCVRGSSCEYHHPSSTCKLLPNCKYSDKCLYIHPLCKNDRDCKIKDCAYDHKAPRKRPRENSKERKGNCKYDSNCKIEDCQYQHKRSCKYGQRCRNFDCTFSHPR